MPRTSVLESLGCPPLRALTFDVLGLIKVIEARGKQGIPTVVERWGEPDPSRCVLATSIDDCKINPLLAVARKNGQLEVLNPLNGDVHIAIRVGETGPTGHVPEDDLIAGLHLFKAERSSSVLACTVKGNASLRSIQSVDESTDWNICSGGKVLCSKVDGSEKYALFGGKGVEINIWDLDNCSKIWTAKSPPSNSLGIFTPTWFTAATFFSKDHRKIVAGTNQHQVRLYDISAQRRPVISFDFRESPIKVITEDLDGHTVYVGNASGDLGSFDMRTGKLLGCFLGKCCGSIRSIVRHPELPIIASCGLDSYLRFWDINTRKPLSAVFLKQHLTSAVIDANFADNGTATAKDDEASGAQVVEHKEELDSEEPLPLRRRKRRDEHEQTGKIKSRKSRRVPDYENNTSQIKTIKSKKSKKVRDYDIDTLVSCES